MPAWLGNRSPHSDEHAEGRGGAFFLMEQLSCMCLGSPEGLYLALWLAMLQMGHLQRCLSIVYLPRNFHATILSRKQDTLSQRIRSQVFKQELALSIKVATGLTFPHC